MTTGRKQWRRYEISAIGRRMLRIDLVKLWIGWKRSLTRSNGNALLIGKARLTGRQVGRYDNNAEMSAPVN
jgi:hypothetical protein